MRLSILLFAAAITANCSPPPSGPRCLSTVLPACAVGPDRYSDEACGRLDDAEQRNAGSVDATRAPVLETPMEGEALPGATPATFRWMAQLARRAPSRVPVALPPAREMTWRDELARWTTLVPEAQAHCAPFSGVGYALTFRAGGRTLLRVEQSTTSYTPDAAAWDTLRGAGGAIEVTVQAARFRMNEVTEGPFAPAAPRRFTITQ